MSCLKFTIGRIGGIATNGFKVERIGGELVSRFTRAAEPLKAKFSLVCDFGDYGYFLTVDGLIFQTSDGENFLVKTI